MGTFGDKLKREREMRAITLEEIAEATKIGTRALRALEEERFGQLPGGIFNKGFVRAYAKYLGLDEEQAVADYLVASGEQPEGNISLTELSQQMEAARERERDEERRRRRPHPLVVMLIVIVVILGAGYGGYTWYNERKAAKATENHVAEVVKETPSQPAQAPIEKPAVTETPVAPTAATPTPAAPNLGTQATEAPITVTLKATGRAWISVTADGKLIAEETMDATNPKMSDLTVHANEKLVLIVGNPGGVQAWFNGKPIEALGTEGQRKSITFTPAGIENNPPQ